MTATEVWWSDRVDQEVRVVRWGEIGTPVLVFPTAGADAWEVERMGLVHALGPLLAAGRIKVYSIDAVSSRSWLRGDDPRYSSRLQNRFDAVVYHEVVPAIRTDCRSPGIEIVAAGASYGAFHAVAALCRHPDVFRVAIGMSGTYDLSDRVEGLWNEDFYYSSPLHWLPGLPEGEQLGRLRSRFVVLATGQGAFEDPGESWKMAHVLGRKGVPNRVDLWSHHHGHDWPTWHEMLPLYLDDLA